MPNPISIAVDTANGQIIVVNSNVDFFFEEGSLAMISVDATDTNAPVLTATKIIATPSFGGTIAFDGGTSVYIPFRESPDNTDSDQVKKYTIGSGSISEAATGRTGEDPFGLALSGSTLLVVSNDQLNLFDTSLNSTATVDLTTAENPDDDDDKNNAEHVENVAVDAATNRAFISNRRGNILVVDLDTNTLTHVINGPTNTRGIFSDGTFIYVVDGDYPALWIFDPAKLTDPSSPPEEVDDSTLIVEAIDIGTNPNGIVIDTTDPTNARAYIANSGDQTISVIDLTLFEEIDRISVKNEDTGLTDGEQPFGLAVGTFNGTTFVFVANLDSNTVEMINTSTLKVVASFP